MTGSEYIAEFFRSRGSDKFFVITGGACAFIIDAVGRNKGVRYYCFQHEQAAAMAADACWRVNKTVGVTVATSGPGATNLLTGIACSYFDSIPSIHITGQVNKAESAAFLGANVRQAGFQETNIVDMAKPVTKYAVQVGSAAELKKELVKAWHIATAHRMGPVLIDVPMNVQKEEAGDVIEYSDPPASAGSLNGTTLASCADRIREFLETAQRPLALFGGGVGLAGVEKETVRFLEKNNLPFVSSWSGLSCFNHDSASYCGHIGVYGNRGANFILQNCDALLVLGSRLDNRQRSGNAKTFAPGAQVLVIDVDPEEIKKYASDGYQAIPTDLVHMPSVLNRISSLPVNNSWLEYISEMKSRYFGKDPGSYAQEHHTISPYEVVMRINRLMADNAVVIADTGANLCWVYQVFHRTNQTLFTAAGNSPMGYSLPAAVGAALNAPHRQVICFIGDGGFQMNIQELQTLVHYGLNVKIIILNNCGYGIIRQFQDSYCNGRYFATGAGYSVPDFQKVAAAYGIPYVKIDHLDLLSRDLFNRSGLVIMEVPLDENTLIEPKTEVGRPIHDQFPYLPDKELVNANRFVKYERCS